MEGVLALLEVWAGRGKKKRPDSQLDSAWYRFVAGILGAEVPKTSRMDPILSALASNRTDLLAALDRELRITREISDARDEITRLKVVESDLRKERADALTTFESQSVEIEKLNRRISDAEDRYRLLDEHWKRSSATNLARKIGSLTEEIGHELQEALLSLDRETPNLKMALNRLRRLQSIIKRQEGQGGGVSKTEVN